MLFISLGLGALNRKGRPSDDIRRRATPVRTHCSNCRYALDPSIQKGYPHQSGCQKPSVVRATFAGVAEVESRLAQPSKWLFLIGLAFVIIALARPRWGEVYAEVFQRSREVIIAMDLSKSMLAEDIKPNRLERAKLVVESLLDNLQGESVGLVVFAGTAFLQSPMSPDYQILRGFPQRLESGFHPSRRHQLRCHAGNGSGLVQAIG